MRNSLDASSTMPRPICASRVEASAKTVKLVAPDEAMNSDQEDDFEDQQSRLLTLVAGRRMLRDGSQEAIKTDLEITLTRNLIKSYETLKIYGH
jgi:hypothetical protein